MNEETEILKRCNRLHQAYFLLYEIANEDDVSSLEEKHQKDYKDSLDYHEKFKRINSIYDYVKQHQENKKERICYWFKKLENTYASLAAMAVCFGPSDMYEDINAWKKEIMNCSDSMRAYLYMAIINQEETVLMDTNADYGIQDIVSCLDTSNYDDSTKWEVLKLYSKWESAMDEVLELIHETTILLTDKNEDIEFLETKFYEYWSGVLKTQSITDILKRSLNIEWNVSEAGIQIQMTMFRPFSLSVSVDKEQKDKKDMIHIGAVLDERMDSSTDAPSIDDVTRVGKIITDRTKLEILRFVKEKPKYGKEIADQLGLTTSTISYHMNALIELSFVTTRLDAGRIYYQTNVEKIQDSMDNIKRFFTD